MDHIDSESGEDTDVLDYSSSDADEEMLNATDETSDHGGGDVLMDASGAHSGQISRYNGAVDSDSDSSLDYGSDDNVDQPDSTENPHQTEETYNSVGYFDTEEEAEKCLHQLKSVYTYKTRYVSTFRSGKEFRCRSHSGCTHRKKLIEHQAGESTKRYQVLQKGSHQGVVVNLKPRGISPVLKPEVDALLRLGMSAGRVRNMLLFKHLRDPAMLALIPESKQMENRKAHLKRTAGEGWEIKKLVTLRNWTAGKICQIREQYFGIDETNIAAVNAMVVLDEFEHLVDVDGASVLSLGIVVTSRAVFHNVRQAVRDQPDTLVLATDGTYRIHLGGGWTLVDCGGISVERSGSGYVLRFRPWLYMFVRTESTFAYERMFRALTTYAKLFFEVDVDVRSASIDHSNAIASALELVWPRVEILTCWEHLLRAAKKQGKRENRKKFLKDIAIPHLRQLHLSRSLKQFRSLSHQVLKAWRDSSEHDLATWLDDTYLTPRWERWSVNSSSIPGFLPTQPFTALAKTSCTMGGYVHTLWPLFICWRKLILVSRWKQSRSEN